MLLACNGAMMSWTMRTWARKSRKVCLIFCVQVLLWTYCGADSNSPCGTVCCIYHKPKAFDESSSDDSSSDASDADSSGDDKDKDESNHGDAGQEAQGEHSSQQPSACGHHHHHRKSKGKHKHKQKGSSSGSVVEIDKGKRNAYEVQPGSKD